MTMAPKAPPKYLRFPEGHPHAGRYDQRRRICQCDRQFWQLRLNPAWLDSLGDMKIQYLHHCEEDELGAVYEFNQCPGCEHRDLSNPFPYREANNPNRARL